jgi:hypothetical protein
MVLLENYSLLNYTGELALPAPCTFHFGLAILYDLV